VTAPPRSRDVTGVDALRTRWERRRGRLTDLVCIGVVLLNGLVGTAWASSDASLLWRLLVTALVATSLWWRRSHPLAVSVGAVAGVLVGGPEVALLITLFSLAIRRRDRVLAAVSVAAAVAYVLVFSTNLSTGSPLAAVAGGIVTSVFFVGLPVAVGAYVGARRDLLVSLRERAERAESEQHLRADQARLAERARIAQEMHDVLAHRVSLVALHAGGLEVNPAMGADGVERAAQLIRTTAHQALEDLRGVLGVLRSGTGELPVVAGELTPQPTLDDVRRLVEASREAGVPVRLTDARYRTDGVPEVVGRTAYRVVQEGLTNVHKHAPGARADVLVAGSPGGELVVEVRNVHPVGGNGAPLVPGAGMGLVGLAERVALAGGRLESGETPDGGFRVRASLPWPADAPAQVPAAQEGDAP